MKTKLFNPFIYLAGGKALLIGATAMLVSALIAWSAQCHFNAVLDFHKYEQARFPMYISFVEQAIILVCLIVPFYIAGRMFSASSIRFIDVAGTLALARWVLIFMALSGFALPAKLDMANVADIITPMFLLAALVGLLVTIWMVALTYNAFTVSCNIKGTKAVISFIVCLLVAEAASMFLCHQLYQLS